MWTARQLLGILAAGLSLLGFGTLLGNQRRANEQGLLPVALALKVAGVALLTYGLWRHVKANL